MATGGAGVCWNCMVWSFKIWWINVNSGYLGCRVRRFFRLAGEWRSGSLKTCGLQVPTLRKTVSRASVPAVCKGSLKGLHAVFRLPKIG